jgi:hypothetical protein
MISSALGPVALVSMIDPNHPEGAPGLALGDRGYEEAGPTTRGEMRRSPTTPPVAPGPSHLGTRATSQPPREHSPVTPNTAGSPAPCQDTPYTNPPAWGGFRFLVGRKTNTPLPSRGTMRLLQEYGPK